MKRPPFFLMLLLATALPCAHGSGGSHSATPSPAKTEPTDQNGSEDLIAERNQSVRPAA
ncbi:hypothetical protein [Candidatus Dactylopiibacterium carminicum]|uniref:hypothetical protein n=1 Tax=Candidatus Dactylopiibacterium carminicum TaxID=857335 RepID=UPI0014839E93|nr:hypothetical protein [Candidatus Dactylopiibacterium carminicum]